MNRNLRGFSLIELITVMLLIGILSVVLFSRLGPVNTAAVQSGRDDIIAALFFAQQTSMMRSSAGNIRVEFTSNTVSVMENGSPVIADRYPLTLPEGVSVSAVTDNPSDDDKFIFDKLGRTQSGTITLTGSGNTAGTSAAIRVEASGYAYAN